MGLGDDGLSAVLLGKDGGGDELVPLLLLEGIDNLLLASLLGLRESLVLSLLMIESKRERVRCDSCSTYGGAEVVCHRNKQGVRSSDHEKGSICHSFSAELATVLTKLQRQ